MCRTKCQYVPWEVCLREVGTFKGECKDCPLKEGC